MPFKNLFTSVFFTCSIFSFAFAQDNEIGLSGSEINDLSSGLISKSILLDKDINMNGADDIFSAAILKKLNNNTYWISKGSIIENNNGKDVPLLSLNEKIINSDGSELLNQVPAEYGYIVSTKNYKGDTIIFISIADKNGNSASDELQLKWNAVKNKFEILNF